MENKQQLSSEMIAKYQHDFAANKGAAVISRAVMKNGIKASSENPAISQRDHRVFNVEVKTGKVTNQRRSGRCWSFATLNTVRHRFARKYNLKAFEL